MFKIINIPNILTSTRIILTPFIVVAIIGGDFSLAIILLVVSALTDGFDGLTARLLNQETAIGAMLDPVADKTLMLGCYYALAAVGAMPLWLAAIVIGRDFLIICGVIFLKIKAVPLKISPTSISKVTTTAQLFAVLFFIIGQITPELGQTDLRAIGYITAGITLASGFDYFIAGIKLYKTRMSEQSNNTSKA